MTDDEKFQTYTDYFSQKFAVKINLELCDANTLANSESAFLAEMPFAFKLASDVTDIDPQSLNAIRHLGPGADQLANYLQKQTQKIDLIMSYILSQEDEIDNRQLTQDFSAGGFTLVHQHQYTLHQAAKVKIFLTTEASAVYCYAELIKQEQLDDEAYLSTWVYTQIREDDRDILVTAALHEQSRQLRALKKAKQAEAS
ncbi:PilZ domain-containing protein [Catenovulum sp. SM1970]|uniref:PilZ domain-containing protein n=1 Tax=Marinifaba aquimaris TaxID=2741323 RepID=UPI0015739C65|nr:PilZ domain-containing protein [Marinifaba aquimaris]NTS77657.1 PilZ domain-containing protein [Marinifaba aquimaris]